MVFLSSGSGLCVAPAWPLQDWTCLLLDWCSAPFHGEFLQLFTETFSNNLVSLWPFYGFTPIFSLLSSLLFFTSLHFPPTCLLFFLFVFYISPFFISSIVLHFPPFPSFFFFFIFSLFFIFSFIFPFFL